jgi:DNA polymerase-3 subunit gamma/tau
LKDNLSEKSRLLVTFADMESYIVSARKYRPQTFETVVGQQHITTTLQRAIQNNQLAQAMLFCGPRGVGKTSCARILAREINKHHDPNPKDDDYAFNIFELDAASNNGVDHIRSLVDQVQFAPQQGKFKVYIIDEVHMLSQQAFNAFLKTLEEPPSHAIFILATTEKHKIIPTILSRCQIFDFKRITIQDTADHLKYVATQEGVKAEEEALHLIARKSDGAMRDALSLFDRLVNFGNGQVTFKSVVENLNILDYEYFFKATDHILAGDIHALLLMYRDILQAGFDGQHFLSGLGEHFRDLMVARDPRTHILLEVGEVIRAQYGQQAAKLSLRFLVNALKLVGETEGKYKYVANQRLLVETCLMRLASAFNEDAALKKKVLTS